MSSIAQKLCDEIVQPIDLKAKDLESNILKSSNLKSKDLEPNHLNSEGLKPDDPNIKDQKSNSGVSSSNSKSASRPSISNNRSRYNGRPTRTIVIKKEKEINKIVPQGPNKAVSINKFKSTETLLKKNYIDVGSNTVASGPLRCDTDCITAVRTREKYCTSADTRPCRYSQKPQRTIPKCFTTTKQIQTADPKSYCLKDHKACTQCVETASFGMVTPFGILSENTTPRFTTPRSSCYRNCDTRSQLSDPIPRSKTKGTRLSFVEPDDRFDQPRLSDTRPRPSSLDSRLRDYGYDKKYRYGSEDAPRSKPDLYASSYTKTTFGSCNRWAIAQYPTRGPDF